jgi:hypothetical protein
MDTSFGNDNTADNSLPEPITEPLVKPPVENSNDPDSDNHFDDANVMNLNTTGNKFEKKVDIEKTKNPEPKALEDVFKQSFEENKDKSKKGVNQYLYYLIIFVIILVGLLFIRQLSLQRQINELRTDLAVTIIPVQTDAILTPTIVKGIQTIKPEEFEEISGEVEINLAVESISKITVKIFDDNGVEVGNFTKNDIELVDNKAVVEEIINITKSPTVSVGYIIVYPSDENINSPISKTISVKFSKSTVANRLNVIGPIKNQLVDSTELDFVGEIKEFKNNLVGMRILDTEGTILIESQIEGLTDKTSQDYVKYTKTIEIGTLNGTTETGNVEFYDISDTNKTSLLTIPIRLR